MQYLKWPYNDGSDSSEAQFTTCDSVDGTKVKQKWWETHVSDWMPSVLQWKAIIVQDAIKEMFKPPSIVTVLEEAHLTQPEPVGGPHKYTSFMFTSFSELFVTAANMATISMLLRDFTHFCHASDKTKIWAGVVASGHDSREAIPRCIGMIDQTRDSLSHKKCQKKGKVMSTMPGPLENTHPLQSKNYPQVLSINISLYKWYMNPLFVPFEDPYCNKVSNNTIHHT